MKADANMKDIFAVIHSRKSVRSFTGFPVNKNDLDNIIKAGMAAPTAVNMQPWWRLDCRISVRGQDETRAFRA